VILPAFGSSRFSVIISERQPCSIKVFDISGRVAREVFSGTMETGRHVFSMHGLPSGVYIIHLETSRGRFAEKVIRIREDGGK
jgi:hypothetical protein